MNGYDFEGMVRSMIPVMVAQGTITQAQADAIKIVIVAESIPHGQRIAMFAEIANPDPNHDLVKR